MVTATPSHTFSGSTPTASHFFESRSEWNSNLCPDVKYADKYGFIIATVGHVLLLRSGLTLHILLLVLYFYLMQRVGGQDDEFTEEEIMRHHKQQDQCNTARKRFNSALTQ